MAQAHDSAPPPMNTASQTPPTSNSKGALALLILKKIKGLLSKKWAIPGCAVMGLVLVVSLCTNKPKPAKYDVEAAFAQEAAKWQGIAAGQSGKTCRNCNGAGNQGRTGCPSCKGLFDEFSGQGTVRTPSGHVIVCSRCQGSGTVPLVCRTCGGRGAN